MKDNEIIKNHIKDLSLLIDSTIYSFLFLLIKTIILKGKKTSNSNNFEKHINDYINKINEEIIKKEDKYISREYSIKNFKNILGFIKMQNRKYAGDILEGILIYVFSFAFKSERDDHFCKYIFNNMFKFKNEDYLNSTKWFINKKFISEELNNNKDIYLNDNLFEDIIEKNIHQKYTTISSLLILIFKEKYVNKKIEKNKAFDYIHKNHYNNQLLYNLIVNDYKKYKELNKEKIELNKYINLSLDSNIRYIPLMPVFRSFLIQIYIYYQNNYNAKAIPNEEDEKIQFEYDLREGRIEGRYSYILFPPIRIEPRITKILVTQNEINELGILEIGKIILFNKNIKTINCKRTIIKNNHIHYLNEVLGIFDNYGVEELNLSSNYIKENNKNDLSKLISHLKGLKTLNLSTNYLKNGLSSFLVILKQLYRKKKTKLENLFINSCLLDDTSFYELGELLKCKYCKLKHLYLNNNPIPFNINFLEKIKKNKSLKKLYLNKTEIGNNDANDIMKIISNTSINYLYLFKNQIISFNDFLRIIYRTKLIKNVKDKDDIIMEKSFLTNLDMSNNDMISRNKNHIILFKKLINETTLKCLDISHILYGLDVKKPIVVGNQYLNAINTFIYYLEKDKNEYIELIKDIKLSKIDINKYKDLEDEKKFKDLNGEISDIIQNERSKYHVYLEKRAKNIINNNHKNIRDKLLIPNEKNKEEYNNIVKKLVNYMKLKRAEKIVEQFEPKKIKRKLIII